MRRYTLVVAVATATIVFTVAFVLVSQSDDGALPQWITVAPPSLEKKSGCTACMENRCYERDSPCRLSWKIFDPHGVDHDRCSCACCQAQCFLPKNCNVSRTPPPRPDNVDPDFASFFASLLDHTRSNGTDDGHRGSVQPGALSETELASLPLPSRVPPHPCAENSKAIMDAVHLKEDRSTCTQVCLPQAFRKIGEKKGITYGEGTCMQMGYNQLVEKGKHMMVDFYVYEKPGAG